MLVKNSFEFDARVEREAATLQEAGHAVTVVAIRSSRTAAQERRPPGVQVLRVARPAETLQRRVKARLGILSTATPGDDVGTAPRDAATQSAVPPRTRSTAMRQARRFLDRALDRRMIAAALTTRPDVVHAHDLNTLRAGVRVASTARARLVYDSHELATGRNLADAADVARARVLEAHLIPRADRVITASPGYSDALRRMYGVDPVTLLNLPRRQADCDEAPRLVRRPGALLAVYVGSIQENRGLETAIRALQEAPSWDLAVVGYGHHRPVLETLARTLGLSHRVSFLGPVPHDRLVETAAGGDAGLCLIVGESRSYRLSVPNKLFEYFAAGLPVLAADLPEIAAIARPTDAAVVCDATDPTDVARALRALDADEQREALGRAARRAHETRYNWEREQDALITLYQDLSPLRTG